MTGSHEVRGSIPLSSIPADHPLKPSTKAQARFVHLIDTRGSSEMDRRLRCRPQYKWLLHQLSSAIANRVHGLEGRQRRPFLPTGEFTGLISGEVNIPILEHPVSLAQG